MTINFRIYAIYGSSSSYNIFPNGILGTMNVFIGMRSFNSAKQNSISFDMNIESGFINIAFEPNLKFNYF